MVLKERNRGRGVEGLKDREIFEEVRLLGGTTTYHLTTISLENFSVDVLEPGEHFSGECTQVWSQLTRNSGEQRMSSVEVNESTRT